MPSILEPRLDDPGAGAVTGPVGLVVVSPLDVAPGGGIVLELQRDVNRKPDAERFDPVGSLDGLTGSGSNSGKGERGWIEYDGTVRFGSLDRDRHDVTAEPLAGLPAQAVTSGGHHDRHTVIVTGDDCVGGQLSCLAAVERVSSPSGAGPGMSQHRSGGAFPGVESHQQHASEARIESMQQGASGRDQPGPGIQEVPEEIAVTKTVVFDEHLGRSRRKAALDRRVDVIGEQFSEARQSRAVGLQVASQVLVDAGGTLAVDGDVELCDELCKRILGVSRRCEIEKAVSSLSPLVAERSSKIVGYMTAPSLWLANHGVAHSASDMHAMILGAAAVNPSVSFLLPTRQTASFRWCLDQGMQVAKPMTIMAKGDYRLPTRPYMPSVFY